ncbi:hypothetical protein BGZ67_001466 [Mortierella alpina]|nr:hypothetical protein BGZ67_001466 [Mortierella alpina]
MGPLLSLRNFPNESDVSTMYSAYFVSYLVCDLMLGMVYYRAFLDPLSGWFHHLAYLAVVSSAASQRNVSTLFAMGTPIEVSTIFLASGHIFPRLRSDILFAVSFFLSRIIYPVVLLPELYLNVESRLYWKVAVVALMVHIHWFHKFIQQQLRYHRARSQPQQALVSSDVLGVADRCQLVDDAHNQSKVEDVESTHKSVAVMAETKASLTSSPSPPETLKNDMSEMNAAIVNAIEVNGSGRHRLPKAIRRAPSRPIFDPSSFKSRTSGDLDAEPNSCEVNSRKDQKTMEQLLAECDQEEFAYPMPIEGLKGNKTFSALALKRLMSSQGSTNSGVGAVRLSRASSVRDAKRRIGLDSVRFEEPPKQSVLPPVQEQSSLPPTPKQPSQQLQASKVTDGADGEATVVIRKRPSRMTVPPATSTGSMCDCEFGTIRVGRGVSVNA